MRNELARLVMGTIFLVISIQMCIYFGVCMHACMLYVCMCVRAVCMYVCVYASKE